MLLNAFSTLGFILVIRVTRAHVTLTCRLSRVEAILSFELFYISNPFPLIHPEAVARDVRNRHNSLPLVNPQHPRPHPHPHPPIS